MRIRTFDIILSSILLFPLLYGIPFVNGIGLRFSPIYFTFLMILIGTLCLKFLLKEKFLVKVNDLKLLVALLLLVVIAFVNIIDVRYSKPAIFFIYFFLFYFYSTTINQDVSVKIVLTSFLSFLLISFLFLVTESGFSDDSRFFGFLFSATIYSVYLEVILIMLYFKFDSVKVRFLLLIIGFLLILQTKTRINTLTLIALPIVGFLLERNLLSKRQVVLISLLLFIFVYPLYQYLIDINFIKEFLLDRYQGQRDASFDVRYYLYEKSLELIRGSSILEFLFGHGSEFSRIYMLDLMKEDAYSHNDFLRLIIDFGVIASVTYLWIIIKIAVKSKVSVVILILYLSSFYHNMVFDFFILSCLIISSLEGLNSDSKT